MDLGLAFQKLHVEVVRNEADGQRRSLGVERGENQILGGSDPTLRGLAAAQRLRLRGSLPPKLFRRTVGSVAGKPAKKRVTALE